MPNLLTKIYTALRDVHIKLRDISAEEKMICDKAALVVPWDTTPEGSPYPGYVYAGDARIMYTSVQHMDEEQRDGFAVHALANLSLCTWPAGKIPNVDEELAMFEALENKFPYHEIYKSGEKGPVWVRGAPVRMNLDIRIAQLKKRLSALGYKMMRRRHNKDEYWIYRDRPYTLAQIENFVVGEILLADPFPKL